MPKIRITEDITLRSTQIAAGVVMDASEQDARQLIDAGHAEAIPQETTTETVGKSPKPPKE